MIINSRAVFPLSSPLASSENDAIWTVKWMKIPRYSVFCNHIYGFSLCFYKVCHLQLKTTKNYNGFTKPDCFFLLKETKYGIFGLARIWALIIQANNTPTKLPFVAFFVIFNLLMQLLRCFSPP